MTDRPRLYPTEAENQAVKDFEARERKQRKLPNDAAAAGSESRIGKHLGPTFLRPVTHDMAAISAIKLINTHFHREPRSTVSIPVQPTDDDMVIMDYIAQQEALESEIVALRERAEKAEAVRYLPIECPVCGRLRLEYWPAEHKLVCEKCGADNDVLADAELWEKVDDLQRQVEELTKVERSADVATTTRLETHSVHALRRDGGWHD